MFFCSKITTPPNVIVGGLFSMDINSQKRSYSFMGGFKYGRGFVSYIDTVHSKRIKT